MKNVKLTLLALVAYGGLAQAANIQSCTIKTIPTENPNFLMFPTLPQLPRIGDVIDLDVSANEITDLTFKSGRALALKKNNATLKRLDVPDGMGILASFRGGFKSPTGDYTGVMYFTTLDEKKSYASIEIARLKFYEGFSLARYGLECARIN